MGASRTEGARTGGARSGTQGQCASSGSIARAAELGVSSVPSHLAPMAGGARQERKVLRPPDREITIGKRLRIIGGDWRPNPRPRAERWSKETQAKECRGEGRGCKGQLRRQWKGLRPMPPKKARRCDFEDGVGEDLRRELEEAAGERLQEDADAPSGHGRAQGAGG